MYWNEKKNTGSWSAVGVVQMLGKGIKNNKTSAICGIPSTTNDGALQSEPFSGPSVRLTYTGTVPDPCIRAVVVECNLF